MKKITYRTIDELAKYFDQELESYLPVWILPDRTLFHRGYLIKELSNKNWGLFNSHNKELIDQYYTKSCALIAAHAYSTSDLKKFNQIKQLDTQYWSNHFDTSVYSNRINKEKKYDNYLLVLDKLENARTNEQNYRNAIAKSFMHTFMQKA